MNKRAFHKQNIKMGVSMIKNKTVTRVVILLNKTLGEKIGDQIGGDKITVVLYSTYITYLLVVDLVFLELCKYL